MRQINDGVLIAAAVLVASLSTKHTGMRLNSVSCARHGASQLAFEEAELRNGELALGNRYFSLVYLALPVNLADPREQLRPVKQRMSIAQRAIAGATGEILQMLRKMLGLLPGEGSPML